MQPLKAKARCGLHGTESIVLISRDRSLIYETMDQVTARIRAGLARVTPDRLVLAPDCGMKYLPRDTAFGKLRALVDGAQAVRAQLA